VAPKGFRKVQYRGQGCTWSKARGEGRTKGRARISNLAGDRVRLGGLWGIEIPLTHHMRQQPASR